MIEMREKGPFAFVIFGEKKEKMRSQSSYNLSC